MMAIIKIFIEVTAIIIIAALIDRLFIKSFAFYFYRIFVAPGIIVHELSHAFFCIATGAKVTSIDFFDKEGGSVTHTKSKIPIIGNILISLAPLLVGVVLIYFLSKYLGLNEIGFLKNLKDFTLFNWLVFYLIFSIAITMTPSRQDILNIIISLAVLVIIFWLLLIYANLGEIVGKLNLDNIAAILKTVLVTELVIAALAFIVYLISANFKNKI